jgi:hypothetical protein
MKINLFFLRWIFLSILFLQVTDLYSQTYHHFVEPCKHWRQEEYNDQGDQYISHYYLDNDTIINSYIYKKCFERVDGYQNEQYNGAFWEDTIERKVYFNYGGNWLFFDFSLKSGDTVPPDSYYSHISQGFYLDTFIIGAIDSIIINGEYLKRWAIVSMLYGNLLAYVYEGIGSDAGLFFPWIQLEATSVLDCVSKCGFTIFPDSSYICQGHNPIGIASVKKSDYILISSNPVKDISTISLISNNDLIKEYKLINILCKSIIERKNININSFYVNKNDISPGTYFYQILTTGSKLYYGKIIVL